MSKFYSIIIIFSNSAVGLVLNTKIAWLMQYSSWEWDSFSLWVVYQRLHTWSWSNWDRYPIFVLKFEFHKLDWSDPKIKIFHLNLLCPFFSSQHTKLQSSRFIVIYSAHKQWHEENDMDFKGQRDCRVKCRQQLLSHVTITTKYWKTGKGWIKMPKKIGWFVYAIRSWR